MAGTFYRQALLVVKNPIRCTEHSFPWKNRTLRIQAFQLS